jgi:hypothetical protein
MLRAQSRPWPAANCQRLDPACHVEDSITQANAGNFTKGHTLQAINRPKKKEKAAVDKRIKMDSLLEKNLLLIQLLSCIFVL